jgi:hypothetical protein
LAGGLLLEGLAQSLGACLHLVKQPRIVDRDDGLISEGLQ